ncbi:MAG TPA: energy transducer TonB, partial [Sphingopyxis sp.]|nr:energy transducer TonB [Sphingopyxis sp.]
MTLIPLISAIVAAPEATTAPAGPALQPRNSYGAGNRHRPVAALFAIGLPAALVAAVALSPMIIVDKPTTATPPWKSIILPKPKPPEPKPDPQPRTQPQPQFTAPPSPLPP